MGFLLRLILNTGLAAIYVFFGQACRRRSVAIWVLARMDLEL